MSISDTKKHSRTSWDRVDAMQDEDVDTSDIPPLDDDFFARATLRMPEKQVTVTVNVDADVLAWFRARGEKLENHINAALHFYVEAHEGQG